EFPDIGISGPQVFGVSASLREAKKLISCARAISSACCFNAVQRQHRETLRLNLSVDWALYCGWPSLRMKGLGHGLSHVGAIADGLCHVTGGDGQQRDRVELQLLHIAQLFPDCTKLLD